MAKVLFIGQIPETVDFLDPALPAGTTAEKIQAGIKIAMTQMKERGWDADECMIPPNDGARLILEKQISAKNYDCIVIGGGLRVPPKSLQLFEIVLNTAHQFAPNAKIAFNTKPEDTADAAGRWIA